MCSVPQSLANPDGSRTVNQESEKLFITPKGKSTPVMTMMASVRSITQVPETYEDLTWKFLQQLPSGYSQVDIVAGTYQEVSLKSAERNARGISSKVMIPSNKSKVTQNFSDFLRNEDNKRRLIYLMQETIV